MSYDTHTPDSLHLAGSPDLRGIAERDQAASPAPEESLGLTPSDVTLGLLQSRLAAIQRRIDQAVAQNWKKLPAEQTLADMSYLIDIIVLLSTVIEDLKAERRDTGLVSPDGSKILHFTR